MYRQYENPYKVQKQLEEAERKLSDAQARGEDPENLIDLYLEIESLRERVNFAWQDDEFEMEG